MEEFLVTKEMPYGQELILDLHDCKNKNINRILSYYVDNDIIYRTYKRGKQVKLQKFRFDLSESRWRWFHVYGHYYSSNSKLMLSSVYGSREERELKEISIREAVNIIDKTKMLFELRR